MCYWRVSFVVLNDQHYGKAPGIAANRIMDSVVFRMQNVFTIVPPTATTTKARCGLYIVNLYYIVFLIYYIVY